MLIVCTICTHPLDSGSSLCFIFLVYCLGSTESVNDSDSEVVIPETFRKIRVKIFKPGITMGKRWINR